MTEVRTRPVERPADRLRACCTIVLDDKVAIHEIRIVEGPGEPFLAMPSRKVAVPCGACAERTVYAARFCSR